MTKAAADTNQSNEILSYHLTWDPFQGIGTITVHPSRMPSQNIYVKSLPDLASFAEILRKEKPMFLRPTGPKSFVIHTGEEPVGEEDHG